VRGPAGAPVLLLVQAGPGFPMISEAEAFEAALRLEGTRRVVYWDQRGTGRSVEAATGALGVEALTDDLEVVARSLCERLGVATLDVAGFSLGGSLALLAATRPRSPIGRLLLVCPDVDFPESEAFAWRFARTQAIRRGHRRALAELDRIGPPPHDSTERFMARVKWVTNFGGLQVGTSFARLFLAVLLHLLRSPHYSLAQVVAALRGMQRTQQRSLGALRDYRLLDHLAPVPVPVTVVQGRLDAAAPPELAAELVRRLDAPRGKRLVWLDDCAHTPHFEAPARFREVLLEALPL
jgi:proline iminopeptidase